MEPFYFFSDPLSITPPSTIAPPKNDQGPSVSPIIRKTNIGFSIGSIIGKIMASKAVTCFMAVVYNMYGTPS